MFKTSRVLTIFFLLIAAAIIYQAIFNANPVSVGRYLLAQIGSSVGIVVSVPPNPFNILAQQLKEKELALADRENELRQGEIAVTNKIASDLATQNRIFIYLLIIGGILLLLILFNFYLDYRRKH